MIRQAFDSMPGDEGPACTAGCDHCCRTLPVTVSPIEVFAILHRLRETGGADPAFEMRLAASESHWRGPAGAGGSAPTVPGMASAAAETAATRPSLGPCPLLGEGGLCMVYSSRPLACRGCVSADVSACAACDDDRLVPRSTVHQLGAAAMMRGVCDSLDALGLSSRVLEIRSALALAFREVDTEKLWLRGEDAFGGLAQETADLLASGDGRTDGRSAGWRAARGRPLRTAPTDLEQP